MKALGWWEAVTNGDAPVRSAAPLHRQSWRQALRSALDELPGLRNFVARGLVALGRG